MAEAAALLKEVRRDLEKYRDPELPGEAIRVIYQEMTSLSALGWRWVLPSYLKHCLTAGEKPPRGDLTEFLIYNLGPEPKFQGEARERLSLLNQQQISCLVRFLEYLASDPEWSGYCQMNIDRALQFISGLSPAKA
jgi:hypothetical protein